MYGIIQYELKYYSVKKSAAKADLHIHAALSLFVLLSHLIGIIAVPTLLS